MTLRERLKAKRDKIAADLKALNTRMSAEDYQENDEDQAQWDSLLAEAEKVKGQLAQLERQEELEREQHEAELDTTVPAAARRQGTAPGPETPREFESFGEFLHAVRFNPNDQRLAQHWAETGDVAPRAEQSMGTGSEGGFMVPTQFRSTLMEVSPQEARIRPRANVIPAGEPADAEVTMPALDQTGDAPDNVYGGVTVNWIAEGGEKSETDANLREITLKPHEVAAYVTVTDKLLRNWASASSIIERLLRNAVISAEDFAFLTGNGLGKPLGLINAGAPYVVNRENASQISRDDINAMTSRILMRGGTPAWLASQSVIPQLQNMRNEVGSPPVGDGALVWDPNMRDSANNQLLGGYPILWNERSPQLGNKGDLIVCDLSYYLIKDGSGPIIEASRHVEFKKNKTLIKITWNVDGQPWLTEPFTQEGGYEVSPFVVLDVPAA